MPACAPARVQLEFLFRPHMAGQPGDDWLSVGSQHVRLVFVRHRRARRYILRLQADGSARVTIPRGGSEAVARQFAERHRGWLQKQLQRQAAKPRKPMTWQVGTEILFRGQRARLEAGANGEEGSVRFESEVLRVTDPAGDLRPAVERHLRRLAERELPGRVLELAAAHQLPVRRVTVRSQRSRWGSCSRRGTVSLNWRLIQAPSFVRDYILLHELMHLREMNHSRRFWKAVEQVCPDHSEARRWLRQHADLLG